MYPEQLKIDGKDLTIDGAGIGATIVEAVDVGSRTTYSVTQWTGDARTIDACIGVVGPCVVTIKDLTVDGRSLGPDDFYGIHIFNADATVTDCRIEDILYGAGPSASRIVSLAATHGIGTDYYEVEFSDNQIPNLQKGGILVMGPRISFVVEDNVVEDTPSDYIAGNGIQLSYGATGVTSENEVSGIAYTGGDWGAAGILLFESGDVAMTGDVVHDCEIGVELLELGLDLRRAGRRELCPSLMPSCTRTVGQRARSCPPTTLILTSRASGLHFLDNEYDGIDL